MAVLNVNEAYPFAYTFEVQTNGATSVNVWLIPTGTIVDNVIATIKTAATTGSVTVGDTDSANGFIAAADPTASAGTVYGDDVTEKGAYLYDGTKKGGLRKVYTTTTKYLTLVNDRATTVEGVWLVTIQGLRTLVS